MKQKLNSAKNTLRACEGASTDEPVHRLQEGLMDMCDAFAHRHEAGVILKLAIEQVGQEIDGGARFDAVFLDDQHPILMMIDQLL